MSAPYDWLQHLITNGHIDYELGAGRSGTWGGAVYVMPPDPDRLIVLGEYVGFPPETKTGLERVGLQVRIRGIAGGIVAANDKLTAIARHLDGLGPIVANSTPYLAVQSQSSGALFWGLDEQKHRPEFSWNFIVWRSR